MTKPNATPAEGPVSAPDGPISAKLLAAILPLLADFEAETGLSDAQAFFTWVQARYMIRPGHEIRAQAPPPLSQPLSGPPPRLSDGVIWRYMGSLYRRMKLHTKPIVRAHGVGGVEEFSLLAVVMGQPGITKSALIQIAQMESSSGNDMINRMIQQGYFEEASDDTNRRIRRLHLTALGQSTLFRLSTALTVASEELLAGLGADERSQLARLLRMAEANPRK
jgi:DNA-binding MarR family transcriptional regulator